MCSNGWYIRCKSTDLSICLGAYAAPLVAVCLPPRWVYMATKHGRRVPESEHAVGGTTLAMEPLKQSSITADKTNSRELSTENKELITPFRSLQPKLNTRVS